jgi:hypothetical protein
LVVKQVRRANQAKTRLTPIAPACEIKAEQKSPELCCEDVAGKVEKV